LNAGEDRARPISFVTIERPDQFDITVTPTLTGRPSVTISVLTTRPQSIRSTSTNIIMKTPDGRSPISHNSTYWDGKSAQCGVHHIATFPGTNKRIRLQRMAHPAITCANMQPLRKPGSKPKQDYNSYNDGNWNSLSLPHRLNSLTTSMMSNGRRHGHYGVSFQTNTHQTHTRIRPMTHVPVGWI